MIRNTVALRDWAIGSRPDDVTWNFVHAWIRELENEPGRAPSVPMDRGADQPNFEERLANLEEVEVRVRHYHPDGDVVDLLGVG